jgi:dimethylaniline monooxygenase (N-oxide forming)
MHSITLSPSSRIAVVGGGPAGIVAAKELREAGFAPEILEQSADLGGQWNAGAAHSGVWPGMRANTSGAMTRFGEAPLPDAWPVFPRADHVQVELVRYAERFGLTVRLSIRVLAAHPVAGGWDVELEDMTSGAVRTERFAAVVGCSGRFACPAVPEELGRLAERVTCLHSAAYRGREPFRGRRVLVVGNSISGLEIAADLAQEPSSTVISSARRGRWIIPKLAAGVPADQRWFTEQAAELGRILAPAELAAGLRAALLEHAGDPASVGGLEPDPNLLATGLGQCQQYLPLVAEGRIAVRPGIASIDGDLVRFADGTADVVDAVVAATGYERALPYVDADPDVMVLQTIDALRPGLAVLGQFVLHGPYFPVLELQARWLAAVWSGRRRIEQVPPVPLLAHYPHHMLACAFAEAAGVAPDADARPDLAEALRSGPMLPERYRLDDPVAAERFATVSGRSV